MDFNFLLNLKISGEQKSNKSWKIICRHVFLIFLLNNELSIRTKTYRISYLIATDRNHRCCCRWCYCLLLKKRHETRGMTKNMESKIVCNTTQVECDDLQRFLTVFQKRRRWYSIWLYFLTDFKPHLYIFMYVRG